MAPSFKRDGFKCVVCGETGKLDIHHIHPKFFGGTHEPQNLISLLYTNDARTSDYEFLGKKYFCCLNNISRVFQPIAVN